MAMLPLSAAAQALGIPAPTLRKRLKAGTVRGERQQTPQGFAWLIEVPDDLAVGQPTDGPVTQPHEGSGTHSGNTSYEETIKTNNSGDQTVDQPATGTQPPPHEALPAVQRAQEMAAYTERLLEPLHTRLEAQAERIGRLELALETANARLAMFEAPETQNGGAPHWPEHRRWWQRLVWG
jgi:hypothetical protein